MLNGTIITIIYKLITKETKIRAIVIKLTIIISITIIIPIIFNEWTWIDLTIINLDLTIIEMTNIITTISIIIIIKIISIQTIAKRHHIKIIEYQLTIIIITQTVIRIEQQLQITMITIWLMFKIFNCAAKHTEEDNLKYRIFLSNL